MSVDAVGQDNYLSRFLRTTGRVLALRTTPMDGYVWPAWLSWAVLMMVDLFVTAGLDTEIGRLDVWVLRNVVTTFVVYSIAAHLLSWWMRRDDRWDGKGGTMLNLLAQFWSWKHGDISANDRYQGDFAAALSAIRARTLLMPCDHDLYFQVADSEIELNHLRNGILMPIPSIWGHRAGSPTDQPEDRAFIEQHVKALLAAESGI